MAVTAATRRFVHSRAGGRCEYCHLPQAGPANLALCCLRCNLHKGTNLSGLDPADQAVVTLFHPRRQEWSDHFRWNGPDLIGSTPTGRATVATLRMNGPERVRLRRMLIAEGLML